MKVKMLCYKIVYIYVSSSNRNCAEFDVVTKNFFFYWKIITNAKDSKKASGLSKSVSLWNYFVRMVVKFNVCKDNRVKNLARFVL